MMQIRKLSAVVALATAPTAALAAPIDVSFTAATEHSSNPQKVSGGASGREDSFAVSLAIEETFGRNVVSADYTATEVHTTGAAGDNRSSLTGTLSALMPVSERLELAASHSAERLTADASAPDTAGNKTSSQTVSLNATYQPLAPGRTAVNIRPQYGYSVFTDGEGEDVATFGLDIEIEHVIDPITILSPYIRATNVHPDVSERSEYRGAGVRFTRALRQLSYFAEVGWGDTSSPSGVGNDGTEFELGAEFDRATYSVAVDVARSIQATRTQLLPADVAALLGINSIGVAQSTTDSAHIGVVLNQVCQRCVVTVDYDHVEQAFKSVSTNDQSSTIVAASLNYAFSRSTSGSLSASQQSTDFDSRAGDNFDQDNVAASLSYELAPDFSLRVVAGTETRRSATAADSYDEWSLGASLVKSL